MNKPTKIEFRQLRILVLDEDRDRAKYIREILDNLGIGVTCATSSGSLALERVKVENLSMALVDLEDRDGPSGPMTFMGSLRDPGRSPAPGLPVLGMMANVTRESLISAVHVGADFVIQRPFSAKTLSDRIDLMITSPAQRFRSLDYVGPDRRRMPDNLYEGNLRRSGDP